MPITKLHISSNLAARLRHSSIYEKNPQDQTQAPREERYSKYGGRLHNSLPHFTRMDYHTTYDSQIFSMAVRSKASTGNTGQMQIPDCLHSYRALQGLKQEIPLEE